MKLVSKLALGAALALTAPIAIAPAFAQDAGPTEEAVEFDSGAISDAVRTPIVAAQAALDPETLDPAAALAQLQTAVPLIANDDDRFIVGQLLIETSRKMGEAGAPDEQTRPIMVQGAQLSLESNRVEVARRGAFYRLLADTARAASDYPAAIAGYQNAIRYSPADYDAMIFLADAHFASNNPQAGYEAADRAIQALTAAGTQVPASWISVPLNAAYEANNAEATARYGAMMVRYHGSDQERVNRSLAMFNAISQFDEQGELDLFRLMRATGSLTPSVATLYIGLAAQRGLPGEAQAAATAAGQTPPAELDAQISEDRGSLAGSEASARSSATGQIALNTADAYAGYGDTAKAIELYDLALQKGGVDADTVNLRRGAALVAAGRTEEARPAFQAVTGAPRAGLAGFWLAWLDFQAGGAQPAAPAAAPAGTPAEAPAETPSGN